jgi:hypothetical protein
VDLPDDTADPIDAIFAASAINRVARVAESLAKQGYKLSSQFRDDATNARVGGAYFSQHRAKTAVDAVTSPAGVTGWVKAAREAGLHDVNEMSRPGHGPHMHGQLYRRGFTPGYMFKPLPPVQITNVP